MAIDPTALGSITQNALNNGISNAARAQQGIVDNAVDSIEDRLETSWSDWSVTHGDVKAIANTLKGLNAERTQLVIEQLDRNGTLDKLTRELTDGKTAGLGGLDAGEKADFFKDMALKLDGKALATLSESFARTDSKTGGLEDVVGLGQAVATQSNAQTKVDYVTELAAQTTDKPSYQSTHFGGSSVHEGDAEATAVGHVLASLNNNPAAAQEAFGALTDRQLDAVLKASVNQTTFYSSHSVSVSLDAKPAGQILDSVSRIGDADLKARVFDAGAGALQHINNDLGFPVVAPGRDDAANTVADGLTKIIDSDTTGVVRELAYNEQTLGGTAISVYAKHLLNTGQTDKLGEQLAKLQLGNDLNENSITRFEESVTLPNGAERHENAGALGHFVAGVYAATESISQDVKQQQDLTTAVLKTTLSLIDKASFSGPISVGAAAAKEWTSLGVSAAIQDPGSSAAEQLERAALPIDPATNELGVGDDAFSAFNDRITQVQRLANP